MYNWNSGRITEMVWQSERVKTVWSCLSPFLLRKQVLAVEGEQTQLWSCGLWERRCYALWLRKQELSHGSRCRRGSCGGGSEEWRQIGKPTRRETTPICFVNILDWMKDWVREEIGSQTSCPDIWMLIFRERKIETQSSVCFIHLLLNKKINWDRISSPIASLKNTQDLVHT